MLLINCTKVPNLDHEKKPSAYPSVITLVGYLSTVARNMSLLTNMAISESYSTVHAWNNFTRNGESHGI